jgi:hypothetical protein
VGKIVGAFFGCEAVEQAADAAPQRLETSWRFSAEQLLELGEDLLDRVEVAGI